MRMAGGRILSSAARLGGGAGAAHPPAPSAMLMDRVLDQRPWTVHSAVTVTSENPSSIRAWKARYTRPLAGPR